MGKAHVSVDAADGGTVADVMLARPKTLPAGATVADLRRLFANPAVRTALLVDGTAFRAAVERTGVPADAPDDAPALRYGGAVETVLPEVPVADALRRLARLEEPRLVVLDADGVTLRGLLCLSGGGSRFCVASA
jgi:CBS domain-containing protein